MYLQLNIPYINDRYTPLGYSNIATLSLFIKKSILSRGVYWSRVVVCPTPCPPIVGIAIF